MLNANQFLRLFKLALFCSSWTVCLLSLSFTRTCLQLGLQSFTNQIVNWKRLTKRSVICNTWTKCEITVIAGPAVVLIQPFVQVSYVVMVWKIFDLQKCMQKRKKKCQILLISLRWVDLELIMAVSKYKKSTHFKRLQAIIVSKYWLLYMWQLHTAIVRFKSFNLLLGI